MVADCCARQFSRFSPVSLARSFLGGMAGHLVWLTHYHVRSFDVRVHCEGLRLTSRPQHAHCTRCQLPVDRKPIWWPSTFVTRPAQAPTLVANHFMSRRRGGRVNAFPIQSPVRDGRLGLCGVGVSHCKVEPPTSERLRRSFVFKCGLTLRLAARTGTFCAGRIYHY